jgi:hypothetical protein
MVVVDTKGITRKILRVVNFTIRVKEVWRGLLLHIGRHLMI